MVWNRSNRPELRGSGSGTSATTNGAGCDASQRSTAGEGRV